MSVIAIFLIPSSLILSIPISKTISSFELPNSDPRRFEAYAFSSDNLGDYRLTYESREHEIKIDYPYDWQLDDNLKNVNKFSNTEFVEFYPPDQTGGAVVSVWKDTSEVAQDQNVYLASTIQDYRQDKTLPFFTVIYSTASDSFLFNQPGYLLIYTNKDPKTGSTILTKEEGLVVEGDVYYVSYSSQINQWGDYSSVVDDMIETLVVKVPATTVYEQENSSNNMEQLLEQADTGEI